MSDLWAPSREKARRAVEPLALRMRPRTLGEYIGQTHILGEGKLLRRMLQADTITSIILHGPPGTGKTTLAEVIAHSTQRHFARENAASVGVKRIREIIDEAISRLENSGRRTILFLDEIHRFTRAQQDVLLGDVERGLITLIGATTENPLFAVNSALVSRSTLFRLEPLTPEEIEKVVMQAVNDPERGYGKLNIEITPDAMHVWAMKCDGDARRALTALEVAVLSSSSTSLRGTGMLPVSTPSASSSSPTQPRTIKKEQKRDVGHGDTGSMPVPRDGGDAPRDEKVMILIDRAAAEDSIQQKAAVYDQTGDEHYDAASAMIKSVRGSDPDAAVYWIARMLEGGEDPRFIARRLAILASEDIGNADPRGIMVAAATWELVERIGLPEARITLSQCACYLALAPKSNASYAAINEAMEDVREGRTIAVPAHIKDGNVRKASEFTPGAAKGAGYAYAHTEGVKSASLGMIGTQDYLGVSKSYYRPIESGYETQLAQRLAEARAVRGHPKAD